MKVTVLLISCFIAVATNAATAADFSQVDLRPYLSFTSHLVVANLFEPTELAYEQQQQFITQGGATFSTLFIQVEQQVPSSEVYRGLASPAQLLALRNNLNSAKIRGQRSCEIKTIGAREGSIDFTWHSHLSRRNVFRVVLTRTGGSGLPPCRQALIQILADLRSFEAEILQNPGTEILRTPP